MTKTYNPKKIEKKWQTAWDKAGIYRTKDTSKAKKYYTLVEFPFPSGDGLHVGHIRPFTAMDIISRKRRMQGYNVLFPIGWDAFGLPTENYAIKTGIHPAKVTKKNTDNFRRQMKALGLSFDWKREINTTDPAYYKWTQWMFLQFLKKGLAYKAKTTINWCPKDKIGLANEEVVGGNCERCGTSVEQREKEQWMIKITAYAEKLLKGLEGVDFLPEIKKQQENWIGKSEGVRIRSKVKDLNISFEVFDSIPQTFMAQTFTVIAPEHPLVAELVKGTPQEKEVLEFANKIKKKREQRGYDINAEFEGIFTGRYVDNPFGTGDLPIWVASFVLADYGTGIVHCSAHDERDFKFAKKYNIPLRPVMFPKDQARAEKVRNLEELYSRDPQGVLEQPKQFAGRLWGEVRTDVISHLEKEGIAKRTTQYHLRDWVFSRQRYWGEPIPVIHCGICGYVPVHEKDLPVKLPNVKNFAPRDDGESPLASISSWVNVKCPRCKAKAQRETDVMPNWAGSSWYFLRYTDPKNKKEFASKKLLKKFMPVDWYNGGMEHVTLHLLYSRFWNQFLYDCGLVTTREPYKKRTAHGLILAEGGVKMSKSKGNVVNPDAIVASHGADVLRMYEMFMGPFDQAVAWNFDSIEGVNRFLGKVWRVHFEKVKETAKKSKELEALLHKTIKQVSEDIEAMHFNTAVSACMIFVNACLAEEQVDKETWKIFLKVLAPFAPHLTEELWQSLSVSKKFTSIHTQPWPKEKASLLKTDTIRIPVQVNGKVRDELVIEKTTPKDAIEKMARESVKVALFLQGKQVKKVIYVPEKIINIVVTE